MDRRRKRETAGTPSSHCLCPAPELHRAESFFTGGRPEISSLSNSAAPVAASWLLLNLGLGLESIHEFKENSRVNRHCVPKNCTQS